MTNINEIWKPIPNYEGLYEVSNLGNVKSTHYGKERVLKSAPDRNGSPIVFLFKNGKGKVCRVRTLVAMCFMEVQAGLVISNKDGNPLNNSVENLVYIPKRQAVVNGRVSKRNPNKTSKFTGVSLCTITKKYKAQIYVNKKQTFLGDFETELEASEAYQKALAQIELNTIYASKN